MILIHLILTLISTGDMFVVRYPVSDTIRGMVYAPLDTFYVEDSTTLFSTNLGFIEINSLENAQDIIDSTYKKILPETKILIERYIRISIIGEVKNPKVIYVNEKEPLSSLIALSGGATQFANLKKVRIHMRFNTLKLNYYNLTKQRQTLKDL